MELSTARTVESSYSARALSNPYSPDHDQHVQRDIHYLNFLIRPFPQLERFHVTVCENTHPLDKRVELGIK